MVHVVVSNICKSFGPRFLYKDFSADFKPGQLHYLLGPNGSGKSTMLKIVAQLLLPDSGRIEAFLEGKPMDSEAYRQFLGLVAPDLMLYQGLQARENIAFLAGMRKDLDAASIQSSLDAVGLGAASHQLVETFSTGMKQRLKFAVLLAAEAKVWILDEPTSNLDEEGKALVHSLVDQALGRGCTVIWATNELGEVRADAKIFTIA